ncbi:substrate-binding domain-containing protein [Chelatococcus composti]|jgi:DNA-binding LacI/PurR family transcriptional regulator|uniref:DNA-binding LacI/PurR family transcriptional regulator n=1 Tax=Chelatococcus composti TaxID=1743235 RepID=A0A841KJW7_9HYPH|nr:substrate-binding domain-containing protein [Chelatococcus composti]MBB6169569.1 DNA-binding LacI/PurR family transcriptional regulator [Chelatococcus composti]MBS7736154.1 substrate-binding domain-containing protein [Chelatococcus composti]GGG48787.1 LacI family transcriptional regulator [Chelatococcus composti]
MPPPRKFVSAREVAERAGVSRSAVSRAFTPGASVSEDTRRRVLEAATALGYHVNHLARGLSLKESGIVCLVGSELGTPYRASLVKAMTQAAQDAGKVAMVINTDRSDESVSAALRQALHYRADASIILSGMPDKSITRLCLENGQRIVLINRDDDQDGPLRINLRDGEAARCALTAFLRAGCRRLAFANSEAGTPSLMARERGFLAAAAAIGLPVTVERFGPSVYESGRELARRLLTARVRPDAVFCATDLIACGFLDAARHEFGLAVPEDLCVTGFDDIEQASWSSYSLTTFAQPVAEIAREAFAWLRLAPEEAARRPAAVELEARMVWRRTVRGRPPAARAAARAAVEA